jgi:hypothetical protein
MKSLGWGSLACGKPRFRHEPPSSKLRLGLRTDQVGASAEDQGISA